MNITETVLIIEIAFRYNQIYMAYVVMKKVLLCFQLCRTFCLILNKLVLVSNTKRKKATTVRRTKYSCDSESLPVSLSFQTILFESLAAVKRIFFCFKKKTVVPPTESSTTNFLCNRKFPFRIHFHFRKTF